MAQKDLKNTSIKRSKIAIWLLILTTILWGTSFIITKNITKDVPIFLYLGLRFSIALFGFIPFFPHLKKLNKKITVEVEIRGEETKEIRMNMETGKREIVKLSLKQ